MKIFTSEEILKDPYITQDSFSSFGQIKYKMTPGELLWLEFIAGKYSIANYL